MAPTIDQIVSTFFDSYKRNTSSLQKVIDVFLIYIFLTAVIQFAYVVLVGTFPFNSFLSGFISCIASFVLTVSLRMQVDPQNKFENISKERAFADYVVCNIILFFTVFNFMG
eukprot:TRINITY_DN1285_c0_g1_i1.p1 TRINITY_DN1285_c0_g1~~TRINITY_DN1285_c0_g1_i1.p1  ORF type:complete len:112 (-),score=26.98 TRINITY_DN1285_c0_g1_i1:53-388(-)